MNDLDWTTIVLGALTLLGVIGGPYLAFRQNKVESASRTEISMGEGNARLITQLQAQVNDLDDDLRLARGDQRELHREFLDLQTTVAEWEVGVRILTRQVLRLGEVPDWEPPERT